MALDGPNIEELMGGIAAVGQRRIPEGKFFDLVRQWLDDPAIGLLERVENESSSPDEKSRLEGTVSLLRRLLGEDIQSILSIASSMPPAPESLSQPPMDPSATVDFVRIPQEISNASSTNSNRFRILRLHSEGGLGRVSLAHDEEVNRPVALKEIKPNYVDDPSVRDQFLLEAHITGALEHPGIVPIYGLGHSQDGKPYYAMRFVRGESLQKAIESFHSGNRGLQLDRGERALEFRQLLGRFVDVCQAIAFAHHRGVLHRDLKPGNIMLGKYSETLVIDWGLGILSKPTEQSRGSNTELDSPLKLSGSIKLPEKHGIAGTPAYMSPEQARGDFEALGPSSDIYSLGGTLFCVLTGKSPQSSRRMTELLERVAAGRVDPPCSIVPEVPKTLNAICMKAMAFKPEDRYADAQQLANDIERWLGDEPVSVYTEPWPHRLLRWARKNRIKVSAGIGTLFTGLVASIIAVILIANEQVKTEYQRNRAEFLFQQARDAVDQYLINVVDNEQLRSSSFAPTRVALLRQGLEYYQRFLDESESTEQLKIPRAKAMLRLAQVNKEIGDLEIAEQSYSDALQAYERLFETNTGNNEELRIDYAIAHGQLGELQSSKTIRREDSLKSLYKAQELLSRESSAIDEDRLLAAQAFIESKLSHWYKPSDINTAILFSRSAAKRYEELIKRSQDGRNRVALAKSLYELANLLGETRQFQEARALHQRSRLIWLELGSDNAMRSQARQFESSVLHELAILSDQLGDFTSGLQASDESRKVRLEVAFVSGRESLHALAQSLNDSGIRRLQVDPKDASGDQLLEKALWLRRELRTAWPDDLDISIRYLESVVNIANNCVIRSQSKEADAILTEAKQFIDSCPPRLRDLPQFIKYEASIEMLYGETKAAQGSVETGEQAIQRAIQMLSRIVEADPTNHEYPLTMMLAYGSLGAIQMAASKFENAEMTFSNAAKTCDKLISMSPEDLQSVQNKSSFLLNSAIAMSRDSKPIEEVYNRIEEAIQLARSLLRANPKYGPIKSTLISEFQLSLDSCKRSPQLEQAIQSTAVESLNDPWTAIEYVTIAKLLSSLLNPSSNSLDGSNVSSEQLAAYIVKILVRAKEMDSTIVGLLDSAEFEFLKTSNAFRDSF
jgi:serine/threonine protein kinase